MASFEEVAATSAPDASTASSSTVFDHLDTKLACFQSRDNKELLMQWNIDKSLTVEKFRFSGSFVAGDAKEYDRILSEFFTRPESMSIIGVSGTATTPLTMETDLLNTSIMTMEFFNRFKESGIVSESGSIRGCFEEIFDGISVGDKIRELLLNEDSENTYLFNTEDKKQFIYAIFKLFAVGGAMCQPDVVIDRYLEMTKSFYREAITVYKDSKTGEVKLSGRVYSIKQIAGLNLFTHPQSSHNAFYVIVDPLKKQITVIKYDYKPYW